VWTGVWGDIPCPAHPRHPGVPPGWVLPICGCHRALCDGPGRSSLVPFVARRSCCCATPNPPTAGASPGLGPVGDICQAQHPEKGAGRLLGSGDVAPRSLWLWDGDMVLVAQPTSAGSISVPGVWAPSPGWVCRCPPSPLSCCGRIWGCPAAGSVSPGIYSVTGPYVCGSETHQLSSPRSKQLPRLGSPPRPRPSWLSPSPLPQD